MILGLYKIPQNCNQLLKSSLSSVVSTISFENMELQLENSNLLEFHTEKKKTEENSKFRKKFPFFCLAFILLTVMVGLWFFLLHVDKVRYVTGYEEFLCNNTDVKCLISLCPQGMYWSIEEHCKFRKSEDCCQNERNIINCNPSTQNKSNCFGLKLAGASQSGYKLFCRPGFLWVPWRRKCFRVINPNSS